MSERNGNLPVAEVPIRVLSVKKNEAYTIRFLGGYRGCLIHWLKDGPIPCPGPDDCPAGNHRSKTLWKGFAPAENWSEKEQLWYPVVFEITEALEETLYGRQLRAQVWYVSRPQPTKKITPVVGCYMETSPSDQVREAFDIQPVLSHVYHGAKIRWGIANPVPPKLCLAPSAAPGPMTRRGETASNDRPMTAEERAAFSKQLRALGFSKKEGSDNGRETPSENGHAHAKK